MGGNRANVRMGHGNHGACSEVCLAEHGAWCVLLEGIVERRGVPNKGDYADEWP